MAFTEREAKATRWDGKDRRLPCGDGLYLLVRRSSKTWLFRDRRGGRETFSTLGKHPAMSTKEARAEALRRSLEDAPDTMTVERLAWRYRAGRSPAYLAG